RGRHNPVRPGVRTRRGRPATELAPRAAGVLRELVDAVAGTTGTVAELQPALWRHHELRVGHRAELDAAESPLHLTERRGVPRLRTDREARLGTQVEQPRVVRVQRDVDRVVL